MIQSPVTELLDSQHIAYDVIEIPLSEDKKPIRNLEELLTNQGRDPYSVVRSVLFKTSNGDFVLLAAAGGGHADWNRLRKQLNVKKLRMADYDEVYDATGYQVGAVPPIALPDHIQVLVDEQISQYDPVIIGSGVLGYALSLSCEALQSLLSSAITGQFIKETDSSS